LLAGYRKKSRFEGAALLLRFGCIALAVTPLAAAQQAPAGKTGSQKPVGQEVIIVTGTYEPAPLEESDRSVDVVDIGQSPTLFRSWADAFRLDSSVDLRQRAPGTEADLSIRGSSFRQTLVLVDGFRVNDAQSAHHNLDLPVPFESIQTIEVLHGSGSTLYGSDALGGAVNFITAAPEASELRFGAAAGNFGTNSQNGSASYLAKRWSEQVSFTRDFSTGFMADRDYRNFASTSETRFHTPLGLSTILLALSDRPFGANQFYGHFNSWERTKGWFAAASQQIGADTQLDIGYRRHTDQFILLRDRPQVYENNHVTESWQGGVRERKKLTRNNTLYYGAQIYRDSIASNNLGYHSRTYGAAYVDFDTRSIGRWSLSAGAREEVFEGGHAEFSPSVAAGYAVSSHIRLRGSISHAFALPTYTDLYYRDPANVGNPSLRPETAWGYEGGVQWAAGARLTGSATLFHRREHDVIDYVRANPTDVWRAVNIQTLQFTGIELLTRIHLAESQHLELAYTGLYGAQQQLTVLQSKYIFSYPVHQASLGWLGTLPGRVQFRARGGITDRYQAKVYPLMEISAARNFGHVRPYAQLTNVTNTGYEEIQGVRMPGRAYLLGMEFSVFRSPRCSH
jgi:iron complex outermembrane receptor protein